MIIKVMTRKEPTFRQLLAYVSRDASDGRYVLTHNLLGADLDAYATEFETNAGLLRQHQNGTVMFHDILSITRSRSLGLERQKEILKEIVQGYIARRAPGHLIYAGLHEDQPKHLHYHLVISANPHGEWRRAHLSKPELRQLQTEMETRVLRQYPELEQKAVMGRKAKGDALTQPGHELKRRTGKVPERQRVVDTLTAAFRAAHDKDELFRLLTEARLELYRRSKGQQGRASGTIGVRDLDTGRNHRLVTLGLADAFKAMSARIEVVEHARPTQHQPAKKHAALSQQIVLPQAKAETQPSGTQSTASTTSKPASQRPSRNTSTPTASQPEDSMNIFEAALQGLGTVIDALSITTDTGKPLTSTTNHVRTVVHKVTTAHPGGVSQSAKPVLPDADTDQGSQLTEQERQAAERLQEMVEIREVQEQQLGDQRGSSLKR